MVSVLLRFNFESTIDGHSRFNSFANFLQNILLSFGYLFRREKPLVFENYTTQLIR
jgi:hypothetical protein